MYTCPNCSANLKYNISRQALFCEACETVLDPYSVVKESDAEESRYYEVTSFLCPQCGGEIITEDNEAAAFCSFCGGSTILDSRISQAKRPFFIIPFQKTKEDCVESYRKMVGRAIFAKPGVRDSKNINSFRGIYMPYISYKFEKSGSVNVEGTRSYQRGDYSYTEHHSLSSEVNEYYDNIAYDASSTFADNLSQAIAPFDQSAQKPFTPSFLSGFYADTSDVPEDLYIAEGADIVAGDAYRQFKHMPPVSRYAVSEKKARPQFTPKCTNGKLVMFPVWFMSLRTQEKGEERVSYAVMNGQTGKIAADIPISLSKYVYISIGGGILLFILLNFLFDITPSPLFASIASSILCLVMSGVYSSREKKIRARFEGSDDKGLAAVRKANERLAAQQPQEGDASEVQSNQPRFKPKSAPKTKSTFAWIPVVLAILIIIYQPVSDIPYYFSAMVSMGFMISLIIRIVGRFNELTTRKLPQFNRTGGDDSAKN